MSYQVLARKYRPQKFSEVIGQEHVTRTLQNAIEQGRTAHGYIFSGHRGIGKTTVARILAMALNCRSAGHPITEPCGVCDSCAEIRAGNSVDVIEIDAATNRGIDEIRELREAARYRPARDRFKIYILDEAHQITDAAFNALLKTLEEPPGHVVFMLATTQPEDIPQTIRSRCQHFSFRAVRFEEILQQLRALAARENVSASEDALALVAEAGDGSMRDALSILDQAIASGGEQLTIEGVRQLVGAAPSSVLENVLQAVASGSSHDLLQLADHLLSEGHSPAHFARQLVRFLRNTLVAKVAGPDSPLLQVSGEERQRVGRIADLFSEEDLTRHLQIMLRTHGDLNFRQEQRFHLELGLMKMAHAQRLLPLEQLFSEVVLVPRVPPAGSPQQLAPGASAVRPGTLKPVAAKTPSISPFAADTSRKSGPKSEMLSDSAGASAAAPAPVLMGTAAPVVLEEPLAIVAPAAGEHRELPPRAAAGDISGVSAARQAVLSALADSAQHMLVSLLETGEWSMHGNEIQVKVAASPAVAEMCLSSDARRLAIAAASGTLGKPVRFSVLPGGTNQAAAPAGVQSNGHGRSRAEQDPVVHRMREKFGAEIRTVIDYRDKK
jgi:DNA polymerase-3 subunit gamma/tau